MTTPATAAPPNCASGGVCAVGDTGPGGGTVFYVSSGTFTQVGATGSMCGAGCKYLEAAPGNWSGSSSDPVRSWVTYSDSAVTGAEGTAIGSGYQNSIDIAGQNGNVAATSAAVAAREYAGGGKTDWYLPSKDELNQLCKWARGQAWVSDATVCNSTGTINTGTGAAGFWEVDDALYWSSSKRNDGAPWYQNFLTGSQEPSNAKDSEIYIRPVRAFGTPISTPSSPVVSVVAPSYRLTYLPNSADSGSFPATSGYSQGTSVLVISEIPTRSGYVFQSWNTASDGTGTSYKSGGSITVGNSNVDLYATWSKLYTLTFDINGGDIRTLPASKSATVGSTLTISSQQPMRTGYTFTNWNSAANGSGATFLPTDTLTVSAAEITLHAQWKVNSYTLTFNSNGDPLLKIDPLTKNYASTVKLAAFPNNYSRTGYTFLGWNTSSSGNGRNYAIGDNYTYPETNVTLYAQWRINQYTISYAPNDGKGGRVPLSSTQDFNSNLIVSAPSRFLSKVGYTFQGWNTTKDGTGKTYRVGDTLVVTDSDQLLYAYWIPNTYNVTFINTSRDLIPNGSFPAGGSITTAPNPPARDGYKFLGWSSTPFKTNVITFPYYPGVTRNITLYAVWVKAK